MEAFTQLLDDLAARVAQGDPVTRAELLAWVDRARQALRLLDQAA